MNQRERNNNIRKYFTYFFEVEIEILHKSVWQQKAHSGNFLKTLVKQREAQN